MAAAHEVRKAVEFYTVEIAELADGTLSVLMTATTVDDEEPQLLSQEIVSERVASIENALTIIRDGLTGLNRS